MNYQTNDPSDRKKRNITGIIRDFLRGRQTAEGEALYNKWWDRQPETARTGELSEEETNSMSERVFLRLKEHLPDSSVKELNQHSVYGTTRFPVKKMAWRAAAAILLFIGGGSYLWHRSLQVSTDRSDWLMTITKAGEKRKLQLGDGTIITLNEKSRISYPKDYDKNKIREVALEGEAFFDVAKDPEHPFLISSLHAEVKVLGTRFNVRANQADSNVVVAMQEGRVALRDDRSDTTAVIYLVKGDVGVWGREGRLTREEAIADNENYFSWMNGNGLGFDGTPISQVIMQLKRIYGCHIVLDNPAIVNRKITLQYPRSDLETVLHVIGKAMNTTIVHTDTVYHIK